MSLVTSFVLSLVIIFFAFFTIYSCCYVIWRCFFQCYGYRMKHIIYKSQDLILQKLHEGKSKTLVIIGNGLNVSLDENNVIIEHDPIFRIPKKECKLLLKGDKDYEVISAYFPFECSGINESSKELASYLNCNYLDFKIIFLAHSKSAAQFAQTLCFLNSKRADDVLKLVFISPAFGGVVNDEEVMSKLGFIDRVIYRNVFIYHKVNEDIRRGAIFLKEDSDFSKISEHEAYLIRAIIQHRFFDLVNSYLLHLDKRLSINGDGIIGYDEQYCDVKWSKIFQIKANHNSSMIVALRLMKDLSIL